MEREPEAVYERELPVSVERIWENVLDWEHLPHLHSQAFTSIRMTRADPDGWLAEVGLPGSPEGSAGIDVRLDCTNFRYTTRTVTGLGAGSEIVTQLLPRAERDTGIRVEFHLPWAPPGAGPAFGAFYRDLYVTLWDQDEAMMVERQRVLDGWRLPSGATRAGDDPVRELMLGAADELGGRLPLEVELGGRRFRVVSVDGRLHAHDLRCPHLGGPLGLPSPGGSEVACPWHGYRFDLATGASCDGRGLRLASPAIVEVVDGQARLRLP